HHLQPDQIVGLWSWSQSTLSFRSTLVHSFMTLWKMLRVPHEPRIVLSVQKPHKRPNKTQKKNSGQRDEIKVVMSTLISS
uniref:Uncharacterized protein n=1 Tax=Oryzias latipes TaxID=8090 RepID=A0A3P9J9F5_ORYLA